MGIFIILFYFLFPALILFLSTKFSIVNKIGVVVICYAVGLVIGLTHIVPESISDIQELLMGISILVGIPLVLFSENILKWAKMAKYTFISLLLGVVSVVVLVIAGYFVFRERLPEIANVSGMMIGVYTGGTMNMAAIARGLGVENELFILTNTVEVFIGALILLFLLTGAKPLFGLLLRPYDFGKNKDQVKQIDMDVSSNFKRVIIILFAILFITAGIQVKSEAQPTRSKNDVDTYIKNFGGTAPDWWDSVELSYPETLNLDWPAQEGFQQRRREFEEREERGFSGERMGRGFSGERMGRGFSGERMGRGFPGGRGGRGRRGGRGFPGEGGGRGFGQEQNSPTMVDQYLIQVVYPNPSRHKEGIKLVNHLMIIHKDDEEKLKRSLNILGQMFYELFDDYIRAAFWWQKYAEMGGSIDSLKMARCYFELGSKATAKEFLSPIDSSYARNNKDVVKLWAKIGEVDKALNMIETYFDASNSGMSSEYANLIRVTKDPFYN